MTAILNRNRLNKDFSRNPQIKRPRSRFGMPNKRLQTMNASYLVPIYLKQVIPGDTFEVDMGAFARFMPQVAPVMDTAMIKTYFFYEPCRCLWDNFTKMMGERKNPNDTIDYVVPTLTIPSGGFAERTIFDYMGIPIGTGAGEEINAMPFRMYNHIWNSYFRSEQLQNEATFITADSGDSYSDYVLLKKNKTPDYFTRNLPDTQLGDGVVLPIGTEAPVIGNGQALGIHASSVSSSTRPLMLGKIKDSNDNTLIGLTFGDNTTSNKDPWYIVNNSTGGGVATSATQTANTGLVAGVTLDKRMSGLKADLSDATMASIIAVRSALALQRALELDNRNGTRWNEILSGRYGTVVPDAFLDRPMYLGGTAGIMNTIPVTQTSSTDTTTPQGNLVGNTVGADGGNVIKASLPEFGYIMGLAVVTVEPQYQQGLNRLFKQESRYDFYHPEFNGIGDQATYNYEIYLQDRTAVDANGKVENDKVFGYNERCAEYKTAINEICGEMRSTYAQSLDVWHYAQKFENLPTLNSTFLEDPAEEVIARTLAVPKENVGEENERYAAQVYAEFNFNTKVYRGIPVYNIPTIQGL